MVAVVAAHYGCLLEVEGVGGWGGKDERLDGEGGGVDAVLGDAREADKDSGCSQLLSSGGIPICSLVGNLTEAG